MNTLPRRHSLASQVVEILQEQITAGAWHEWLPSERELAEKLHVSRNTLRAAIAQLARSGIVRARHPVGTQIVRTGSAAFVKEQRTHTIGLLSPDPIDLFRPNVALIVDELRGQLADIGLKLRAHHGQRYFSTGSGRALARLVTEHPYDCWILVLASEESKRWFHVSQVKCVVSGSCAPGVGLPFVDLDYRALCRHASGQMIRLGHRRLAYFAERSSRAGIVECRLGFLEGIALDRHGGATGEVVYHQNTTESMKKGLDRLFASTAAPTAMLVTNPHHYLFAQTYLQNRGLNVPRDVSLVSADDDPFLAYVHPSPTRYEFNAHTFASRLFKLVMKVVDDDVIARKENRIMPDYLRGATLAPHV